MRNVPLLCTLLLALLACGRPTPDQPIDTQAGVDAGDPSAGKVRIATFNVRRFFDTVCDSGACGPDDFEEALTQDAFDARADQLAAAIDALDADVMLLQEIETQTAFNALVARLPKASIAVFGEIGTAGSVDVGIVARGSLQQVLRHRDSRVLVRPDGTRTSFSREMLEAHLTVNEVPAVVFTTHFRSKNADDPGRRLAEAQASAELIAIAAAAHPESLIVFGGDLNDEPGSDPIDALESSGELLRVASELPAERQSTYTFDGVGHAIDHLFVDQRSAGRYVSGSVRTVRDPGAKGYAGSDHAALVADFTAP